MSKKIPSSEDFNHIDPKGLKQKARARAVIESLSNKARDNIDKQDLAVSDIDSAIEESISNARQRQGESPPVRYNPSQKHQEKIQ